MPITIEMPKLSDTMTEGTLVRWIKKVGDNVAVGDVLAEVETDKATMEMEAFDEGVLAEIYVQDGNKVEVGQKLAILVGKGEKIDSGGPKPDQESKPAPEKKEDKPPAAPPKETTETKAPAVPQRQQDSQSAPAGAVAGDRIKASPLAKKIAAEMGVDLATLQGSGPEVESFGKMSWWPANPRLRRNRSSRSKNRISQSHRPSSPLSRTKRYRYPGCGKRLLHGCWRAKRRFLTSICKPKSTPNL